jgi:DNA-binding transcriptional LysR family regulator
MMTFEDLRVFVTVAAERSFSRAARKLRRTQPAVSQSIRRLEVAAGERLIDRSSRDGTLTDAGELLLQYGTRLLHLADETTTAMTELRDVRSGRVLIGANEAGVHTLLPLVQAFQREHPSVLVEVRRVASRHMAQEVMLRNLDFGILTFAPSDRELSSLVLGIDELVVLVRPDHPFATQIQVSMEAIGQQTVIAHNDPSPMRERVLQMYEQRRAPLNIRLSLPSLDGIKRAVALGLGVAILPRRCAQGEISRGELVEVRVPDLRTPRHLRFVYRRDGELSHAASAFLAVVRRAATDPEPAAARGPRAQRAAKRDK